MSAISKLDQKWHVFHLSPAELRLRCVRASIFRMGQGAMLRFMSADHKRVVGKEWRVL